MSDHPLKTLIEAADRSISAKDFDGLMRFYTDDATLVMKPDMYARGKDQIRRAFEAISAHFDGQLKVRQDRSDRGRGHGTGCHGNMAGYRWRRRLCDFDDSPGYLRVS